MICPNNRKRGANNNRPESPNYLTTMGTHYLKDPAGRVNAIITMADIYEYKGIIFEHHRYLGPCKLKKDWEPAARQGRKFWKA